ncbi:MAG: acyl-CoA dehydrogenase family protein [Deltaproteobacteria bacterium]|nr:acyl-CoA dehydrogenase family protein [Deltaproteobacteria bacterium]
MVSFEPSEDQQLIQSTVRSYAEKVLRPRLRDFERARCLPDEVMQALHEMGVTTLTIPESAGGPGLGLGTAVLAEEELAAGDAAVPYAMGGAGSLGAVVMELGTDEQKTRLLAPFCEPDAWKHRGALAFSEPRPAASPGLSTTATRTALGWRLDGKKSFVLNGGIAQATVVFAQVDQPAGWEGLGAFVIESDRPGMTAGPRMGTVGLDAAHFGELVLEGCVVPEANRLSGVEKVGHGLLRAFSRISLHSAARAVGLSRAAFDITREYCETRQAFGKPIGHFQAIAFTLADRLMDLDSARWMLWRAAARWDAGKDAGKQTAMAAAHAFEVAMRAADDAVQLHGGAGFIRDVCVEKMMRDAKTIALTAPPVAVQDALVADGELGVQHDLAAVLPTPDIQPIFT